MGVTITATNPKYEFDMGYFGFLQLRKEIALANKEFGRNYADVLDFLYMPDSEGEVGYFIKEFLIYEEVSVSDRDYLFYLFSKHSSLLQSFRDMC